MRQKVLIIDDSPEIQALLRARLKDEPIEMHFADCGPTGLAMAAQINPDIILLDIEMPEMDGYALAAAIRALGDIGRRPVILAITAADIDMNERDAHERGFDGYMLKPLELAILEAKLVALTRQAGAASAS